MAPRKKRAPRASEQGREFKLRLPPDVSERIEAKAMAEGRPQNRVIINELASIPYLERLRDFGTQLEDMKTVLARHSARIVTADLTDDLLNTLREMLKADESNNVGELRARLAKVRVILSEMERNENAAKR